MLNRIFDLAKIQNKIKGFNDNLKQQYYEYLIHDFGALFTFHSNRIEGTNTTLTFNDTKEILNHTYNFKFITDKNKLREIHETLNHQKAFQYIFEVLDKQIDYIQMFY